MSTKRGAYIAHFQHPDVIFSKIYPSLQAVSTETLTPLKVVLRSYVNGETIDLGEGYKFTVNALEASS